MSNNKLKPCPFCGYEINRILAYDPFDGYLGNLIVYMASCTRCNAQITRDSEEEAIEAWNRRTPDV